MAVIAVSVHERDPSKIAFGLRQLSEGRTNANGVVNLAASATSTVVVAPNCAHSSSVFLFPASAHAAAEWIAGTLCVNVADVKNGKFTVTHVNNGQTDRTFFWVALG